MRLSCEHCGAPLPGHKGRGKSQRFCSPACKQAAYRQRQNGTEEQANGNGCQHCGQDLNGKEEYCSDRCYYYANKDRLPRDKMHLAAWDEELIPVVARGQQKAFEHKRPDWHAWVYGGAPRP